MGRDQGHRNEVLSLYSDDHYMVNPECDSCCVTDRKTVGRVITEEGAPGKDCGTQGVICFNWN